MAFNKKRKDISMAKYAMYLLDNGLVDMSEEDIVGSLDNKEITKNQLVYLIQAAGGMDVRDKEKMDIYFDAKKIDVDSLKKKLESVVTKKGASLSVLIDQFTSGNHDGLLGYLKKMKKQFNLKRTKQRNRIQFDRIIEYAKDKPELMDKLTEIDGNIFIDESSANVTGGFANILTYFKELSRSRLKDYDKKFGVAPTEFFRRSTDSVKRTTAFTGSKDGPFQVTAAFEYFMNNNSLDMSEFKPRKIKTSLVLAELVKDIDGNKLDKYRGMTVGDRDMAVDSALRSIRNEDGYKGNVTEKARFLKEVLDGEDINQSQALRAVLQRGDVKIDRTRVPKRDIMLMQSNNYLKMRNTEEMKDFADDYFDGEIKDAIKYIRKLRDDENKANLLDDFNLDKYKKGTEIIIPQKMVGIFEELKTEEEVDIPSSLSASARNVGSESFSKAKLNDGKFSIDLNLADLLETIAQVERWYVGEGELVKENKKYINGNMEYDDLIPMYEKKYTKIRNGFRDEMIKKVNMLYATRSESDLREIINRSFNVQEN
tara:strand:- start:966 stop:2585 length:1620 start_codon:yes stop_codon:yes gene_type:complete